MGTLRYLAALAWIGLAPLGCTDGSSGETEGESSSAATGEVDVGCACIMSEDGGVFPSDPICGALLCPLVEVTCEDNDGPWGLAECRSGSATLTVSDPDALTCALEALRDRTEGFARWVGNRPEQSSDYGYVSINADGRGVARAWSIYDLDYAAGDAVLGELDPAATFEACLGADDEATRFFCLVDALADPIAICDPGWEGSSRARAPDPRA